MDAMERPVSSSTLVSSRSRLTPVPIRSHKPCSSLGVRSLALWVREVSTSAPRWVNGKAAARMKAMKSRCPSSNRRLCGYACVSLSQPLPCLSMSGNDKPKQQTQLPPLVRRLSVYLSCNRPSRALSQRSLRVLRPPSPQAKNTRLLLLAAPGATVRTTIRRLSDRTTIRLAVVVLCGWSWWGTCIERAATIQQLDGWWNVVVVLLKCPYNI